MSPQIFVSFFWFIGGVSLPKYVHVGIFSQNIYELLSSCFYEKIILNFQEIFKIVLTKKQQTRLITKFERIWDYFYIFYGNIQ